MILTKLKSVIQSKYFWLVVVLVLNLYFLKDFCVKKEVLFIDEGFSYGMSNSSSTFMPDINEEEVCQYNPSVFHQYLTVQPNEIWNYKQIKKNLVVHPPLYYFIFHTINLFFMDAFSKWAGLILNIILFLLTQIVLYVLSRQFLDVKKSMQVLVFYGFSVAAVCTLVFIRSYMLFTLVTTLLCLLSVKLLQAAEADKTTDFYRNLFYICLTLFFSFLTHYYFLIAAFGLCAGICLVLLCYKMYKKLAVFTFSSLFTIGLVPLLFTCVRRHLFNKQDRSGEVASTLHENFINHAFDIEVWTKFIRKDFLGHIFSPTVLLIIALIYGAYLLKTHQKINKYIVLLAGTLIFSVLVISAVIPLDIRGSESAKRYFFHLGPLFALMFVLILELLTRRLKRGFYVSAALVLGLLISGWHHPKFSVYFYEYQSAEMFYVRNIKDKTLWIQWEKQMPSWKLVEPALYAVHAKQFIVFRDFSDDCFQNMWADENAKQHAALMLENKGTKPEDCAIIPGNKLVFSTWAVCAYLPDN